MLQQLKKAVEIGAQVGAGVVTAMTVVEGYVLGRRVVDTKLELNTVYNSNNNNFSPKEENRPSGEDTPFGKAV